MKPILTLIVALLVCGYVHADDESAQAFQTDSYTLKSKEGKTATLRILLASEDGLLVTLQGGKQVLVRWDYLDLQDLKEKQPWALASWSTTARCCSRSSPPATSRACSPWAHPSPTACAPSSSP